MPNKLLTLTNKNISGYYEMINDKWRNQFFYNALNKHAKDKVVIDIGSGTGILAFYALAAGAKFVYAVDLNKPMVQIIDQVLSSNFDRSRFTVIHGYFPEGFSSDKLDSIITKPIDILVTETVGPGLFDHGMIHIWNGIKPYLATDAISIPDRLSCDLWVWKNIFDTDYQDTITPFPGLRKLDSDACIDIRFFEALVPLNKDIVEKKMRWVNINALQTKPDYVHTDKVSYMMDSLPIINSFPEKTHPLKSQCDISFDFDLDTKASIAVIGKMSFESDTLYIIDAPYMPWKYAPMFNIDFAGKYRMVYNNHEREHHHADEWKVLKR